MTDYQNTQVKNECQMVALFNALRFFGMSVPRKGSQAYRLWSYVTGGRSAACDGKLVQAVAKRVGLKVTRRRALSKKWIKGSLPVAVSLRVGRDRYHDVLIVDTGRRGYLLANWAKKRLHWMTWKQMKARYDERCRLLSFSLCRD